MLLNSMKNVLIVGAHFDDVELGVGGTAAKLIENGANVYKLTLTDNVTNFDRFNINVEYDSSRAQSAKACAMLGVKELTDFKPVECTKLEYSTELMQQIETYIYDLNKGTIIYYHYEYKK